jgi:hypothetical protein
MASAEPFGPFRGDMNPVERVAQLRVLRALVHVYFALPELEVALKRGEIEDSARVRALQLLDAVPSLKRRHILATFAYLHRPGYTAGCVRSPTTGDPNGTQRTTGSSTS